HGKNRHTLTAQNRANLWEKPIISARFPAAMDPGTLATVWDETGRRRPTDSNVKALSNPAYRCSNQRLPREICLQFIGISGPVARRTPPCALQPEPSRRPDRRQDR